MLPKRSNVTRSCLISLVACAAAAGCDAANEPAPIVAGDATAPDLPALRAEGHSVLETHGPALSATSRLDPPRVVSDPSISVEPTPATPVLPWRGPVFDICRPGAIEACYNGPADTLGVGACQAGQRVCNPGHAGWGPCNGQVLPSTEVCSVGMDLDCNGVVGCAPGHLWSKLIGDDATQLDVRHVYEMATDPAGNVLLTGAFSTRLPADGQMLTSAGKSDAFVIKLDASGDVLWARRFGGSGTDVGRAVTTDTEGNVLVAGTFANTVDFGTGPLVSASLGDMFVVKLDPSGSPIWSQRYGTTDKQVPGAIAAGVGGEITVAGSYIGSLDFGQGPQPVSETTRTFVVRLDPGGAPVWSRGFDAESSIGPTGFALHASGDVVVTGWARGWVDFGSGPVGGAGPSGYHDYWGVYDGFVVRLASGDGATVWGKVIGGPAEDRVAGAAFDATQGLVVTGRIGDTVDLGGGVALTSAGGSDVLLAKLDADTGDVLWGEVLGNASDQAASSIALDAAGNIVLLGHYEGTLDLGAGLMSSPTDYARSRFLAKLDPTGALLWSRGQIFEVGSHRLGADDERSLAVDAAGNILFAGATEYPFDYGGGVLDPLNRDIVIAKYAP